MYFKGVFGLCVAAKIQRVVKSELSVQQTCPLQDGFVVCSKGKFCTLQGFPFPWKVRLWLPWTFMGIACLLKGEQSPNIYSSMLNFLLNTEMWCNRHKREPYSLQTFSTRLYCSRKYNQVWTFLKRIWSGLHVWLSVASVCLFVVYYREVFVNQNQDIKTGSALGESGSAQTLFTFWTYGSETIFSPGVVKAVITCFTKRQFYDHFS